MLVRTLTGKLALPRRCLYPTLCNAATASLNGRESRRASYARWKWSPLRTKAQHDEKDEVEIPLSDRPKAYSIPSSMTAPESWFGLAAFLKVVLMLSPSSPFLVGMYRRGVSMPYGYTTAIILGLSALGLAYLAKYVMDSKLLDKRYGAPLLLFGCVAAIAFCNFIVTIINLATKPLVQTAPAKSPSPVKPPSRPAFGRPIS